VREELPADSNQTQKTIRKFGQANHIPDFEGVGVYPFSTDDPQRLET